MIYKIPELIVNNIFKRFGSEENGYVFLLIFRRKWLISNRYLSEEQAHELFPSSEMCLGKCYVPGHEINKRIDYKVNQLLSIMTETAEKKMVFKGNLYDLKDIYNRFPNAISLMFTFPRDTRKASKRLIKKSIDVMLGNDNVRINRLCHHYDQEWISLIQATSHRKYTFGFIDIDYDLVRAYNKDYDTLTAKIEEFCNETNLKIIYCVTTISGGIHLIVELNRESSKTLFSKHYYNNTIKILTDKFLQIDASMVEIGTTSNKITHLPFNENVKLLNIIKE